MTNMEKYINFKNLKSLYAWMLSTSVVTAIVATIYAFSPEKEKGLKVGDVAQNFELMNVDGKIVSLTDYYGAKGFIIIFTCNHCPFSVAYEDRIIALDEKYASLGFPVIAINPNDPKIQPEDSFENMIKRAEEKDFPFPYLFDKDQSVAKYFGAVRTPHVFVLEVEKKLLRVKYIGAIDNNVDNPDAVTERYVEDAVDALLAKKKVPVEFTKAIGCTIKWAK